MENETCGACIHFPLCYEVWRVEARNPCKHRIGNSLGFFRSKDANTVSVEPNQTITPVYVTDERDMKRIMALKEQIAVKDEALRNACVVIGSHQECPPTRHQPIWGDKKLRLQNDLASTVELMEAALTPDSGRVKTVCRNCGKEGAHFVGPSFGEPGFYTCDLKKEEQ